MFSRHLSCCCGLQVSVEQHLGHGGLVGGLVGGLNIVGQMYLLRHFVCSFLEQPLRSAQHLGHIGGAGVRGGKGALVDMGGLGQIFLSKHFLLLSSITQRRGRRQHIGHTGTGAVGGMGAMIGSSGMLGSSAGTLSMFKIIRMSGAIGDMGGVIGSSVSGMLGLFAGALSMFISCSSPVASLGLKIFILILEMRIKDEKVNKRCAPENSNDNDHK